MKLMERYFSVFILGVLILWLMYTGNISAATMPGAPGPTFFPYLIIGTLAALSILLFALSFKKSPPEPAPKAALVLPDGDSEEGEGCIDPDDLIPDRRYVIFSFLLIFFYVVGIDFFGFYAATVPAVFLALKIAMQIKRWLIALFGTAAISGSVYIVFTLLLKLPLPKGSVW